MYVTLRVYIIEGGTKSLLTDEATFLSHMNFRHSYMQ